MDTVWLDEKNDCVNIIDQTLLPNDTVILSLTDEKEMWDAIYLLKLRGAPAIGVGAALFLYVLAKRSSIRQTRELKEFIRKKAEYLNSSRPTAVNLKWALDRMLAAIENEEDTKRILSTLKNEAKTIWSEDIEVCKKIGEYGATLIEEGDGILTHCNAGRLATVRFGTATAPMYEAFNNNIKIKVYCDETRPLLQGARLTAYELNEAGLDVTLLCDNMSSSLMKEKKIQKIFVGCDRVAANGDTANKIGTSAVAILAKHYDIPFYVCAPFSTIDLNTKTGTDIIIEQRNSLEVTSLWYEKPMAPKGIKVYNPAFDVTDHNLITGFVTEKGILNPPFSTV